MLAKTIAASCDHTTDVASPRARAVAESGKTIIAHGSMPSPIASGPDGTFATLGPREDGDFGARYSGGKLLGRGGMGEVRQYTDAVVGRSVAIKFLRTKAINAEAKARFVREARVQGQLQHPAVVPVYDLGLSSDGETFFTMKRLGGRTLGETLKELRGSDPEVVRVKQRQLLIAFSDVCLVVDYAHTRGVVHRDLKPANIMLGDFGEVYVLDWGLARLADDADDHVASEVGEDDSMRESGKIEAAVGITSANMVMGTVGYMAPEQLLGQPIASRLTSTPSARSSLRFLHSSRCITARRPKSLRSARSREPASGFASAHRRTESRPSSSGCALTRPSSTSAIESRQRASSTHVSRATSLATATWRGGGRWRKNLQRRLERRRLAPSPVRTSKRAE